MLDVVNRSQVAALPDRRPEPSVAPGTGQDPSMRVLEVLAAGIALAAAILLSLVH